MVEPSTIMIVVGVSAAAGFLKGTAGLGLSTVCLAIFAVVFDPLTAIMISQLAALVTNVWQSGTGGHGTYIIKRIWPFLITSAAFVWIGAGVMVDVDVAVVSTLLGLSLIAYGLLNPMVRFLTISAKNDRWAGPLAGVANGLLTGMTGSLVVPGVMYLKARGFSRSVFIQAMGIFFTNLTVMLSLALWIHGLFTLSLGMLSVIAAMAALTAMAAAQAFRESLPERLSHTIFYVSLRVIGMYMVGTNLNYVALAVTDLLT